MRKNILVGVCGGISSYKTAELVRLLVKNKYAVRVLMTPAAKKFISPLTFQTLSGNRVYWDMFEIIREPSQHINLAQWAKLCVIAPLTANTLSKISSGICDNLLTTVVMALGKVALLLAPAMNENMWNNPFIKKNLAKLKKQKNIMIIPPQKGELACGVYGEGRMAEPAEIYKAIQKITSRL